MLRRIYDALFAAYGPQHWWPADTPLEVVVGAILTQNTAWANVERAIDKLKRADALSWEALRDVAVENLATLIQPSGTYRVKSRRLKNFVDVLWSDHGGSLDDMLAGDVELARKRLLQISGVGPETADAILLYAGQRITFVVDAYTRRILGRHFLLDDHAGYETVRAMFHDSLPADEQLFNEYHALLVEVGKQHCRVRATCEGCPLDGLHHDATL